MATIEQVYLDRDNTIELILKEDGAAADLSSATKVEIVVGDTSINSATTPTAFDLSSMNVGKLILKLGAQNLAINKYPVCPIYIYNALNVNGFLWNTIGIVVTSEEVLTA